MHLFFLLTTVCLISVLNVQGQSSEIALSSRKRPPVTTKDLSDCVCTAQYDPVCGSDGKTYGNACVLGCQRKTNPFVFGLCESECPCCAQPFYNEPLSIQGGPGFWGWDQSPGAPHPALVIPEHNHMCDTPPYASPSCICTMEYAPVCGNDGKTYGNGCAFRCQQKISPCLQEACKGPCPCCSCQNLFPQPTEKNSTTLAIN